MNSNGSLPISRNAYAEPISQYRGSDYIDYDYGNTTHVKKIGLPVFIYDPNLGEYVPNIVTTNSTHINVLSAPESFSFNKSDCTLTVYGKPNVNAPTFRDILIQKEKWTMAWKPNGQTWNIYQNPEQLGCTWQTWTNATGKYLEVTRQHTKGALIVTYGLIDGRFMKPVARFTNDPTNGFTNAKVSFVEQWEGINTNGIFGNETQRIDNTMQVGEIRNFTHNQLKNKAIRIFDKNDNVFVANLEKGFDDLIAVQVTKNADSTFDMAFGYGRNRSAISLGETIYLDPEYSTANPTVDGRLSDQSAGDACNATPTSFGSNTAGGALYFGMETPSTADNCFRSYIEWSFSITAGSTITDTHAIVDVQGSGLGPRPNCDIYQMHLQPSSSPGNQALWTDMKNGTKYISNSASCATNSNNVDFDLGASADSDVQAQLDASKTWFAISFVSTSEGSLGNDFLASEEDGTATPKPTLVITYTLPQQDYTFTLTYANGTAVTAATLTITNSSTTCTPTINSTGQAVCTGQTQPFNATTKLTNSNFIGNKTLLSSSGTDVDITINVYKIDCSQTGSGADIELMENQTDGHYRTAHTTPTCSSGGIITWNTTETANGNSGSTFNQTARFVVLNGTAFGKNAISLWVNSTQIDTTFSSPVITSGTITVGTGMQTKLLKHYLYLDSKPDCSGSTITVTPGNTQNSLSWGSCVTGVTSISNYLLYSGTDGTNYPTLINTNSTNTTYTDTGLNNGQIYYYKLQATNSYGNGVNSTAGSGTPVAGGSSSSQSGVGGSPSVSELLQLITPPLSYYAAVGQRIDDKLTISWNIQGDLKNIEISVENHPAWIRFTPPVNQLPQIDGKREGKIPFVIQLPNVICPSHAQASDACIEKIKYEIPIKITGKVNDETTYITQTITIHLEGAGDIGTFMILGGIGFVTTAIIVNSKRDKFGRLPIRFRKPQKLVNRIKSIDRKSLNEAAKGLKAGKRSFGIKFTRQKSYIQRLRDIR